MLDDLLNPAFDVPHAGFDGHILSSRETLYLPFGHLHNEGKKDMFIKFANDPAAVDILTWLARGDLVAEAEQLTAFPFDGFDVREVIAVLGQLIICNIPGVY
jgi:hypothetical protein